MSARPPRLTCVEDAFWVVEEATGVARYDFDFGSLFRCRHPAWLEQPVRAFARMGAAPDYAARFAELEGWGVTLVNSPEEYDRASLLPLWYPRLEGLTPRSVWFEEAPSAEQIEAVFDYPVFLKGERQTHRHDRSLSIVEGRSQLREVLARWRASPILRWQRIVAREFVALRPVAPDDGAGLPKVFELRSFWWRGACLGIGPYWPSPRYRATPREEAAATELGAEVARRLAVPFLVVDLAQRTDGSWCVIEVNDGQDSGYMGVEPMPMWRAMAAAWRR